jgi:hypothetical protein
MTNANTSAMVYVRRGKTTSKSLRSCATVSAGAFFPQPQLQVPQKEMRQHRRQHMVVPARVFAHFIVGHPELGFAFFKALFNGLITNDKFCCTRWERLPLSWRRGRPLLRD